MVTNTKFRNRYTRYISICIVSISTILLGDILLHDLGHKLKSVSATSINYGISQQPITDINQLMPRPCQNQSVICEGSFCIPGVKKCVCDLRLPVQISRFCLRQIDIDTKCFATSQCNHTVKDAVCIDINSRAVLDLESTKFKLEQWHQLNELKKSSQSTISKDTISIAQQQLNKNRKIVVSRNSAFLIDQSSHQSDLIASAQHSVIPASARNSPYEIRYDTPELLQQNHTRRRTNNNDRTEMESFLELAGAQSRSASARPGDSKVATLATSTALPQTTTQSDNPTSSGSGDSSAKISTSSTPSSSRPDDESGRDVTATASTSTSTYSDVVNRKKITIKTTHWPPGICSCPIGFMFDPMLRKCLALSLADSHCLVDADCKQIVSSHCSLSSRKCECDEPFVWDQQELACTRPKQSVRTEGTTSEIGDEKRESAGFMDNLITPLILAKIMPDYTVMLAIFVVLVIVGTLLLLKLTVKCFSSNSSALISPKNKRKKFNQNNPPTRSPYATLRRPENAKSASQLSNFTQVTRGRILNYDFEQESPRAEAGSSPSPAMLASATLRPSKSNKSAEESSARQYSATLRSASRGHNHHSREDRAKSISKSAKREESIDDTPLELNDNISLSHLESEGKSDSSNIVVPAPPPTQPPPYMLKNPMPGQSSAIAAAAAAVANKRLQKKNLDQLQSNGRVTSESPVFL